MLLFVYEGITCPDGWTVFRNNCFRVFNLQKTWAEAELACQDIDGHLAIIRDEEEEDAVRALVKYDWSWIGLRYQSQKGSFIWVDGSNASYVNWLPGQPYVNDDYSSNDYSSIYDDHCVHISDLEDGWYDQSCTYSIEYICEISY